MKMMNVAKKIGVASTLAAALTAGLVGCGKTTKDVTQTIEESGLMKTWSLGCHKAEILDKSAKTYYEFSGKDLKKVLELYDDANCTKSLGQIRQEGQFDLRGSDNRTADAKDIDFHFNKFVAVATNPDSQKFLEKVDFCDHNSWPVNQPVDVSANVGSLKCPLPKTHDEYDIYKLNGDNLVFGEGKFFGRAESADKRPTKLANDQVYHPENKTF